MGRGEWGDREWGVGKEVVKLPVYSQLLLADTPESFHRETKNLDLSLSIGGSMSHPFVDQWLIGKCDPDY
ncbi:MAG TPA: hypothetical protein DD379_26060 [Cyanobacteria bacterium UBA11162]|nr:hypothetical protein [Cyanobacteria bacterium UBA11162]